jgi:hypothetical protein
LACVKPLTTLFCIAAAALALAACGDDETTTTVTSTETVSAPASTTASTVPEATTSSTTDEHDTGLPEERCRGAESPPNIVEVISYGADCGAVEEAMAEIQSVSRSFRIGDFQCTRTGGSALSGTWECRGEASYFTFEFGD